MSLAAVEIDGRSTKGSDILTALAWLTDPRRKTVVTQAETVCRIAIFNAHEVKWNPVTTERIERLVRRHEQTGREVAASVLYDGVKACICFDSYSRLRESIFVPPNGEKYYTDRGWDRGSFYENIDETHVLKYDANSIFDVIREFNALKAQIGRLKMAHSELDERVKLIVEQTVSARLTSLFFESAEMRAIMSGLEDSKQKQEEDSKKLNEIWEFMREVKNGRISDPSGPSSQ